MRLNRCLVLVAAIVLTAPARAFDQPFLPLGGEAKIRAGSGVLSASGAPSILYNPANLSLVSAKTEAYAELSVMALRYGFKYPGFGATTVDTTTPVPLVGLVYRLNKAVTIGITGLVAPSDSAPLEAKGIPSRQLSEEPALLDIQLGGGRRPSYLVATGLSWRVHAHLALGLSVAQYRIYSDLSIVDHATGQDVGGIDADVERHYVGLGLRWRPAKWLAFALAADLPHVTSIHAAGKSADGESSVRQGFRGGRERIGVQAAFGALTPYVEVQAEHHGRDRGDPFALDPAAETQLSTVDTLNSIFGVDWSVGYGAVLASYGHFPTPLGDGVMADRATDGVERQGVSFGRLDGVTRHAVGFGYRATTGFGRWLCGAAHQQGRRSVPETSRGYGDYDLRVSYLGCDVRVRL